MALVLVVEDDPLIASFIRKALGREGYDVEWVPTGKAALERVAAGGVDLQLLDLGLPDIDGLDVLRSLQERGERIPVIVITSRSDPVDRATAEGLGVDAYLMKPFPLATLLSVVSATLSRRVSPD
ncbi:MAG: response regulator transcription factor [Acidimicrobiales bacterium]